MTKASRFHLVALREKPAEAEIISHQLMLRAGLISQVSSGIYSWLPLGLKTLRKVEAIVCKHMEATGCNQMLMPGVHPAELWQESGRWQAYGPELLRLKDRHQRDYCLGPTHEEIITDLIRQTVRSYRDLPLSLFQIQTKFRDEIRPRFGVMRSREFIMKDAYSFHRDQQCLQATYDDMYRAYNAIFSEIGFAFRSVSADSGSIGGDVSREFHVLADSGEDALAVSTESDYAANVELAPCPAPADARAPEPAEALSKVATPDAGTIDAVCTMLDKSPQQSIKVLIVHRQDSTEDCPRLVALVLRGDHRLNEVKAQNHPQIHSPLKPASEQEIADAGLFLGFIGPVNSSIEIICDHAAALLSDFVCGANEKGYHYTGANWQRDCSYDQTADLRDICEGDPAPDGQGNIRILRGIEVGHIFQLGTKYSEAMTATVKDENNQDIPVHMGCYGIGIGRIVAAFIEQQHDDKGIVWSPSIAPFHVHLIALRYQDNEQVREQADALYNRLSDHGIEVLLDDRPLRAGILFSQADLFGIPWQIVISERTLETNSVEINTRATGEKNKIPLDAAAQQISEKLQSN